MLRNNKGSALPLVLVTIFVLTLFGTTLWQYSIADSMHVARDERAMQAQYLAQSGASNIANYLIKNPAAASGLIAQPESDPVTVGNGTFKVDVYGSVSTEIVIKSTGKVGDIEKTVYVTLIDTEIFGDFALFGNSITLSGNSAEIYGDVYYTEVDGDNFKSSIVKNGTIVYDPYRTYPAAVFPTGLTLRSDIKLSATNDYHLVNDHGEYNSIDVSGGTLEFNLNGDLHIYAHTMKLTGNGVMKLSGNGRLLLYVDNYTGGGTIQVNPSSGGDVTMVVFVKPGGLFDMNGTPNFWGAIYAPYSTVNFSGTTSLTGSVIADDITGGGKITVRYEEIDSENLPISSLRVDTWSD